MELHINNEKKYSVPMIVTPTRHCINTDLELVFKVSNTDNEYLHSNKIYSFLDNRLTEGLQNKKA